MSFGRIEDMEFQMAVADQLVKVAVLGVASACSAAAAWVAAKRHSKDTIKDLEGQIEKLNTTLKSVLATFEMEVNKSATIMAAIALRKPATRGEMMKLLMEHNLNIKQINVVMNKLKEQGFFEAAAA